QENQLVADTINEDKKLQQALRLKAEEAKKALSQQQIYTSRVNDTIECGITRHKVEELIAPIVAKTIESCRQAMGDAKLKPKQIDAVIMVGGSTRVPLVYETVSE